jgi:hypothetical protein
VASVCALLALATAGRAYADPPTGSASGAPTYQIVQLALFPGDVSNVAGINQSGDVVGSVDVDPCDQTAGTCSGPYEAFFWSPSTGMILLGNLGGKYLVSAFPAVTRTGRKVAVAGADQDPRADRARIHH